MASASSLSYHHHQPSRQWATNSGAQNYQYPNNVDPSRPRGLEITTSSRSPTLPIQNLAHDNTEGAEKVRIGTNSGVTTAAQSYSDRSVDTVTQPPKEKKRSKGMLALLTLKDPSTAAFEEFAQQHKKQSKNGRQNSVITISTQKLPDSVPKVNSRWDGLPQSAQQKPKISIDRRDSGVSGRAPLSLNTTFGKSSASPNEAIYSPLASSNVLPDDSKRREFPFHVSSLATRSNKQPGEPTSNNSSQSTFKSPGESDRIQPFCAGALPPPPPPNHEPLPAIPSVSSLVDEMALPSPSSGISPPISRQNSNRSSSRNPPSPLDDTPKPSRKVRMVAIAQDNDGEAAQHIMGGVSKAKVEAYLKDQANRKPDNRRAASLRSRLIGGAQTSHQRTPSDPFDVSSHQQKTLLVTGPSANTTLLPNGKLGDERPRSFITSNGPHIKYSMPPPDVPHQRHTRQLSSPRPDNLHSSPVLGTTSNTSSQNTPRRNFSRPLAGIATTASVPSTPTVVHELRMPSFRNSTAIVPPAPVELGPPAQISTPGQPNYYKYREPSREIRIQNHTIVEAPTDAAKDLAMSTAFWETATRSTEQAIRAGTVPANTAGVVRDCRLEGPFDPTAAWE